MCAVAESASGGTDATNKHSLSMHRRQSRAKWQRRPSYTPAPGFAEVPSTFGDRVDVSILLQYFAASSSRPLSFAEGAASFIRDLVEQFRATTTLSFEVLVNSDSRHVRNGDARTLLGALASCGGFLLLSPNVGEAFAFNALARIARGEHLLLLQDDWTLHHPPNGDISMGWLTDSLRLFGRSLGVGLVGYDVGISKNTCIRPLNHSAFDPICKAIDSTIAWMGADRVPVGCGPTMQEETAAGGGRQGGGGQGGEARDTSGGGDGVGACQRGRWGRAHLLGAQRCVSMGPLLMRRSLFVHLGGFDERIFQRGKPASLLDCDLSARVWAKGLAVVLAAARPARGGASHSHYKPFTQRLDIASAAWTGMDQQHALHDFQPVAFPLTSQANRPPPAMLRSTTRRLRKVTWRARRYLLSKK